MPSIDFPARSNLDQYMKDEGANALLGMEVYDRLISDIISQELAPGARVVVDKLARELGVSQTPIRQALARLQSEGLVQNKHNAGFRIAPLPSKDWVLNSLEYRQIVEPAAARLAAQHMTPERQADLLQVLEQLEECKSGGPETYGEFAAIDVTFHGLIAEYTDNDVIAGSLDDVRRKMIAFRMSFPDNLRLSLQADHHAIFDAISRQDAAGAYDAMHAHISSAIIWVNEA